MEMHELNNAPGGMIAASGANVIVAANGNGNQQNNGFNTMMGSLQQQQHQQQQISMNQGQPQHPYNNAGRTFQGPRFISEQNHRELPVDVPDSFIGYAKESPRYPPTKKSHQQHSAQPVSNSQLSTFNNHHHVVNQATGANNVGKNSRHQQSAAPPIAQSTATIMMTHNSSLRSSMKLKQLEKSRGIPGQMGAQMQPAINQAFELNEDDIIVPTTNGQQQQQQPMTSNSLNQQRALKMKQSMPDLCSIYNRLQKNLNGDFTDASGDAKLVKLLSIYNTIVRTHDKKFRIPNLTSRHVTRIDPQTGVQEPVVFKVSSLLQSIRSRLRQDDDRLTGDVVELLAILCKHEVDGVCSAFDRIAQSFEFAKATSSPQPTSPQLQHGNSNQMQQQEQQQHHTSNQVNGDAGPMDYMNAYPYHHQMIHRPNEFAPDQVQMSNLYPNNLLPMTDIDLNDEACTKIVSIDQNPNQPLGATIRNEKGSVKVGRIICGGTAHKTRLLNEGDELLEVNGISLQGKNVNEVVDILQGIQGTITFLISPRNYQPMMMRPLIEKFYVRTFFNYDGENDRYIPCKELGLSFDRGAVLNIIDQSDPKWWQARHESDSEWRLAGLIPSAQFLKEREKETDQEDAMANVYYKREKKNIVSLLFNCPKGAPPRRRKKLANLSFGPEETPYYEEVAMYYPTEYQKRPIILVGPKNIGQGDIVANLLRDTDRFARVVSHTSKPMSANERDGVTFHFVSRAQFEADMKLGKFIECGQYQNHYYGTSLNAIKDVIKARKTCVHLVNCPSILSIRSGQAGIELKPFFVFVRPDDSHPEKLRNLVETYLPPKSNIEENIKAILAEVELIDAHYLPYFDLVLTVSDIDRATEILLSEIEKIEKEIQWIPAFWRNPVPTS